MKKKEKKKWQKPEMEVIKFKKKNVFLIDCSKMNWVDEDGYEHLGCPPWGSEMS